jgi:hypothetical protein
MTTESPEPLLRVPTPYELGEEMQRLVLADLLGPARGDEVEVDERNVRDRYLVGMLAPHRQHVLPEEHDELGTVGAPRGARQAVGLQPRAVCGGGSRGPARQGEEERRGEGSWEEGAGGGVAGGDV